jgi:HlyD family secretion protein
LKKRIIIIVFVVLFVGVGALVYFGQWKAKNNELYYSGTIEATEANLAFQAPGRVLNVLAREGQAVEKGQLLVELDRMEYQSRLDQAKANVERSLTVKQQAITALDIYRSTLPADVARAEANVAIAKDVFADAKKNDERYEQLFKNGVVTQKERDAVKLHYDTAKSRLVESEAFLRQARSNLQKIDATKREIEGAQAQINLAKAALAQTEIQLEYTCLKAPFGGVITSRNVEPGEVVSPSREVITLSDLSRVDLKIFVDETEIAKVKPGQDVDIKVDSFPDKVYKGKVSFISPDAEFTPKIIQTHKERVKLVYLVKVSIDNPSYELKSGMPADAWLR